MASSTVAPAGRPSAAAPVSARRRATAARALDLRDFHAPSIGSLGMNLPIITTMRELFGAELPADITYSEGSAPDAAVADIAFTCSYDEGFCGHFSIPGGNGSAARFDDVFAKTKALDFMREHLEFRPLNYEDPAGADAQELVVFAPGLNTLHMIKPGYWNETTTPQRLVHYAGVLQRPMTQMHLGTDMDQGEAPLPVSGPWLNFIKFNQGFLDGAGVMPRIEDGHAYLAPRQRDRMEAALARVGFARPLFQNHIVELLEKNEEEKQPLVLMPYSRSTGELSSALHTYIDGYVKKHAAWGRGEEARDDVEELLREYVTVFTIGNVNRKWPDGPAYVHMSGLSDREEGGTDPLTRDQGVSVAEPEGAGADAVFLHPDGLFSGFDAHNFGASGASNLRIIMNMNGCVTFRDVWERAQEGPLRLPTYKETAAGVELCNGKNWLWNPDQAWNGVQLMHPDIAREILGEFWE